MSNKHKHLDYIQAVITRMGNNSFLIKGWAITLTSALLALGVAHPTSHIILIANVCLLMFWILDAFFLATEQRYRKLYNKVRKIQDDTAVDFDMNPTAYAKDCPWFKAMFTKTFFVFYPVLIALTCGAAALITY